MNHPRVGIWHTKGIARDALADHLRSTGLFAEVTVTHESALSDTLDLWIIDDEDGTGIVTCAAWRADSLTRPVVLLTAPDRAAAGLDAGADEVLVKPLRLGTLVSVVRSLTAPPPEGEDFTFGRWRLLPEERVLIDTTTDERLRVTEKEAAILSYLHADGGVVARETLLAAVWGYSPAVTTHTLETHVYRLRQKIEDDPATAVLLVTEDGGYALRGGPVS